MKPRKALNLGFSCENSYYAALDSSSSDAAVSDRMAARNCIAGLMRVGKPRNLRPLPQCFAIVHWRDVASLLLREKVPPDRVSAAQQYAAKYDGELKTQAYDLLLHLPEFVVADLGKLLANGQCNPVDDMKIQYFGSIAEMRLVLPKSGKLIAVDRPAARRFGKILSRMRQALDEEYFERTTTLRALSAEVGILPFENLHDLAATGPAECAVAEPEVVDELHALNLVTTIFNYCVTLLQLKEELADND